MVEIKRGYIGLLKTELIYPVYAFFGYEIQELKSKM